jgi:hypothetical protein
MGNSECSNLFTELIMALRADKTQTSLVITLEHKKQVKEYSERTGATMSATVRVALNQFFAAQQKEQQKEIA